MKCNIGESDFLDVGKLFEISCQSDSTSAPEFVNFNPDHLELRLSEAENYKLKILKAEKFSDNEMKLTVTSYKAGEHNLKALQIVDGDKSYVLGDLKFTVKSTIDPKEPRKEPFPSIGPFAVQLPMWYWLTGAVVLILVIFQIYWSIRQRKQKK